MSQLNHRNNSFIEQLSARWHQHRTLLCVGLDPDIQKLPKCLIGQSNAVFEFCRQIVDATAQFACAFKPQIAYFAALRAEEALEALIAYIHEHHAGIPVILDAKRGDIGATATQYAKEAFERYQADAVTVNPYMGGDTILPYAEYADRGVIVLCRTSNTGSGEFQSLLCDGKPLYQQVAIRAANEWNRFNNIGLVVGATYPNEIKEVRALVGDMPLLVPGIGAQGGDLVATMQAGQTQDGTGLMINASRAILYASQLPNGEDFAQAAKLAAQTFNHEINLLRQSKTAF